MGAGAAAGATAGTPALSSMGAGYATQGIAASQAATAASGFNPLFLFMGVQSLGTLATSYSNANAAKLEGEFQSSMYQSNARIQALMATDAINRGEKEAVKAKQAANRLIGSQRVAMGAQGIDLESGSALDIQAETASLGAQDALTIRNNAWREAWGYRTAENEYTSRAKYAQITGTSKSRNTILTGGLSIAKNLAYASYLSSNRGSTSSFLEGLKSSGGF